MVNGAVAGMAAICAGCDSLAPWAAVVTGCIGGIAFIIGRSLLEKLEGKITWFQQKSSSCNVNFILVDDPVDAFPIHFCGGLAGLLTAPFLIQHGIFFKRDAQSAVVKILFVSFFYIYIYILFVELTRTCELDVWLQHAGNGGDHLLGNHLVLPHICHPEAFWHLARSARNGTGRYGRAQAQ